MRPQVRVARVVCPSYENVGAAFRRALELAGDGRPWAARGEPLLVKPNFLAPRGPEEAVTTHPAVIAAALAVAADLGARAVVADSPGFGSAAKVARASGAAAVCRRFGVPVVDLGRGEEVSVAGGTFRDLRLARQALEAPWLWNLAKWKTHTMMGLTLGVKNLYGCVPGKRKLGAHFRAGRDPAAFARQLLDLEGLLRPRLTVLDGVVAMDGAGPGSGTPRRRGLVLASADAPALDWEAARLSGFRPGDVPTVAVSLETGRIDPQRIRVVGDPAAPTAFAPAPGSPCDWPLPAPLRRLVRGVVSPAPRFDGPGCTGCGVCVEACPATALAPGMPPAFRREACIRCYCCQELCPSGAVRVSPRALAGLFAWPRGRRP